MRYGFGGLIFRGAYTWRAYFRNSTVTFFENKTQRLSFLLSPLSISDRLNISNCCLPIHAGFKGLKDPLVKRITVADPGEGPPSPHYF